MHLLHINMLELKMIHLGLPSLHSCPVRQLYYPGMAHFHSVLILTQFIVGSSNAMADMLNRKHLVISIEWTLNQDAYQLTVGKSDGGSVCYQT